MFSWTLMRAILTKVKKVFFKRQKIIDVLRIVSGSNFSLGRVKCYEEHQPNKKYLVRTITLDAYNRSFHETSEKHSGKSSEKVRFREMFLPQISSTGVQFDPRTPAKHI